MSERCHGVVIVGAGSVATELLAAGIEDVGQAEQEPSARLTQLLGPGEFYFQSGEVGLGKLIAEQGRQACQREREV